MSQGAQALFDGTTPDRDRDRLSAGARTASERTAADHALWQARRAAFAPGEFVGQQGFMTATDIAALAVRAGIARGVAVLDVCCGVGGPGLFVAASLGCTYLGVDQDPAAIALARQRADQAGLTVVLEVARVPPLPPGPHDVVMLLETLLAFPDKRQLLEQVHSVLAPGGRFACTVQEGLPLTDAERQVMPAADTVWLTPLPELVSTLAQTGFRVTWQAEHTGVHHATVASLAGAYRAAAPALRATAHAGVVEDLVTSHELWSRWLGDGRVRTFALVAQKV